MAAAAATGNLGLISSSFRPLRNLIQTVSISTSFSSLHVGKRGVRAISNGSEKEDPEVSSAGSTSAAGGVVALGKFDALHVGHRALAIQASQAGPPFLVSFVGIAEVLGWAPRVPIVAKCDRERVLSSWASYCGDVAPSELSIEFASVRHLTPRQFVEKLCTELGVSGVVAGENYRFGYKAAGTTSDLVKLCEEYGMKAYIVSSVMDKNQTPSNPSNTSEERGQVSSTRVRHALAEGDMEYVSDLLGRNHRLVLSLPNEEEDISKRNRISALKSSLLNLPPKDGIYENCSLLVDNNIQVPCRTIIDSTHIHVEFDNGAPTHGFRTIHLEFGSNK